MELTPSLEPRFLPAPHYTCSSPEVLQTRTVMTPGRKKVLRPLAPSPCLEVDKGIRGKKVKTIGKAVGPPPDVSIVTPGFGHALTLLSLSSNLKVINHEL
jgi:hypothetical protein